MLLAALSVAFGSLNAQALDERVAVVLVDPECAPGICRCRGEIEPSGELAKEGFRAETLTGGQRCVAADFDGDGTVDLALDGSEGSAALIRRPVGEPQEATLFDAGGVLELYEPRALAGPHGEPASEHHGLLVRHVGLNDAVFLWDGNALQRTIFPAIAPRRDAFSWRTHPLCWRGPRWYRPGPSQVESLLGGFEETASVFRVQEEFPPGGVVNSEGSYAFHVSERMLAEAPSGSTEVTILLFTEKPYLVKLVFSPVFNLLDARWIGDAWLYLDLALGRRARVEAIYDVESEAFVSKRPQLEGESLFRQFQANCRQAPLADRHCHPECWSLDEVE